MNTESATAGASSPELWLRFLSGPDIDALGISNADIVTAVEDAVRAHGEGRAVLEPRVHLVPDSGDAGHFNVLRGHLSAPGVSGVIASEIRRSRVRSGLVTNGRPDTIAAPMTAVALSDPAD